MMHDTLSHPLHFSPTETAEKISEILKHIRRNAPIIQCITNYVSMNIMANILLSLGASPAMVHAEEEVSDFVKISSALVVNIGTLSPPWVKSMELATQQAVDLEKPWVLDPVGCGATPYRTKVSQDLAKKQPTLIRGNASEIFALREKQICTTSKGMDASLETSDADENAHFIAKNLKTIVAISGNTDRVTDGISTLTSTYGSPLMIKVTALGCSLNSVMAAFLTACPNPLEAAHLAFITYGIVGQKAASLSSGPGSFAFQFLDALHTCSRDDLLFALESSL